MKCLYCGKKMAKLLLLLPLIFLSFTTYSQQAVTSGGGSFNTSNIIFNFTIGESFNQSYSNGTGSNDFKEGFLQSIQAAHLLKASEEMYHTSIYPNPFSDILHFDTHNQPNSIEILNSQGRLIRRLTFQNQVELTELPSGIYFIRLYHSNEKRTQTFKVTKY